MKKILLFFILILTVFSYGQTIELQKLASGKLERRAVLYNYEEKDIFGYFYIFKKDKVSPTKEAFEYVLLDKNLNKVSSGEFSENKEVKTTIYFYISYLNGYISLRISEYISYQSRKTWYRLLDIKENKLSDKFGLTANLGKEDTSALKLADSYIPYYDFNTFYYLLKTPLNTYKDIHTTKKNIIQRLNTQPKKIYFVNEKLDTLWSYNYNLKATPKNYSFINDTNLEYNGSKDILVLSKYLEGEDNEKKKKQGKNYITYIFLNTKTGKVINEITPNESEKVQAKEVGTKKIFLENSKNIIFLGPTMDKNSKKNNLDEERIQGFSKAEYSISTGKELKRSYFQWNQLSEYLNIDEKGYIREKGEPSSFLYLHDVLMRPNGSFLFIMEQYKPLSGSVLTFGGAKINDLLFFELDKEMKLVQFHRIKKEMKTLRLGPELHGFQLDNYNAFDYSGYQDLGKGDYLFFYYNKQRSEDGGKKQWILGIVSYTNGKFSEQKIPLKSEDESDLFITPAKKGYMMIYETFKDKDKSPEIRLEKINY